MNQETDITLEVDRAHLEVVLRALSDMHAHYGDPKIVDPAALMVSRATIAVLIAKLAPHVEAGEQVAVIPMNRREWIDYTMPVRMADRDLPSLSVNDLDVLESLTEQYDAWDDCEDAKLRAESGASEPG